MAAPLTMASREEGAGSARAGVVARPVKILLVDDQPGRLLTYRTVLEPLGEELVEASSGEEALRRVMDGNIAVILLDVNMPGIDGFETASLIHQHPRFEQTPIIFVTAVNVGDLDRLRGYKLGAVDYVSVPVIPEILRTKVAVFAELHRKRIQLQALNADLQAANALLRREKETELDRLNESLRLANEQLAARNAALQSEVSVREKAEARLIEADRRKDEFLATLAHELRNPLAPLRNALAVRRVELGHVTDPLLDTMERQSDVLSRLIDDLLDVARITHNKLVLQPGPVTLQDVLQMAVETSMPTIQANRNNLRLQLPDAPTPLHGDAVRLAQVFANLLHNASKYSDPGTDIDVVCTLDSGRVSVEVRDHGVGLSTQELARVFDLFAQADTSLERRRGGLGIGLTLAQRIVGMHGGELTATSRGLGQGSAFTVVLKLARHAPAAEAREPAPSAAATDPERRVRALVVDDNRDAADTLAILLDTLGFEVHRDYSSEALEHQVQQFQPAVVFLDLGMPGRNGFDAARSVRALASIQQPMLIAVTGWGQPEDVHRAREAGFDRHITKPADLQEVRDVYRALVEAGRARTP